LQVEWVSTTLWISLDQLQRTLAWHSAVAEALDALLGTDRGGGGRGGGGPSCQSFRELVLPMIFDGIVWSGGAASPFLLQPMLHIHLQQDFAAANEGDDGVSRTVPDGPGAAVIGRVLRSLGMTPLTVEAATEMLFEQIKRRIGEVASTEYDSTGLLLELHNWLDRRVLPWLSELLGCADERDAAAPPPSPPCRPAAEPPPRGGGRVRGKGRPAGYLRTVEATAGVSSLRNHGEPPDRRAFRYHHRVPGLAAGAD
jgi:hypothetical protein